MNAYGISSGVRNAGEHAAHSAKQTVREFSPWVARIGRLGFASIGVVYILIGILAVQGASSLNGTGSGTNSALSYIGTLPYGRMLLGAVAVGLVFYALWRFTQSLMDTDAKGSDAKGFAIRSGFAAIGLFYVGLALSALSPSLGTGGGEGSSTQTRAAWLLEQPFGPLLVAAVGAAVFAGGLYFFYKAWTAKFKKTLLFAEMSGSEEKWGTRFGRLGFTARGVVFCIIGAFLALAGLNSNAGQTRDFAGALRLVENQSYGAYLLMLMAFGLFSYGLFMLFLARYRRMVSSER